MYKQVYKIVSHVTIMMLFSLLYMYNYLDNVGLPSVNGVGTISIAYQTAHHRKIQNRRYDSLAVGTSISKLLNSCKNGEILAMLLCANYYPYVTIILPAFWYDIENINPLLER